MYRVNLIYAPLAQLVEQLTLNQWVLGSSPRWCTTNSHTIYFVWLFLIVVAIFGGQLLWPLTWLIVSGLFCFSKEFYKFKSQRDCGINTTAHKSKQQNDFFESQIFTSLQKRQPKKYYSKREGNLSKYRKCS